MNSSYLPESPLVSESARPFTIPHWQAPPVINQLMRTLGAAAEAFPPSIAIANSIAESVRATRSIWPLTGALDPMLPSYLQEILAAYSERSKSVAGSLAAKPVMEQLTWTLRSAAEAFRTSIAIPNSVAKSVQVTKSISPLTDAIDRLRSPFPPGIMAALGDNYLSISSLAGSQMDQQRRILGTIAGVSFPSMTIADSVAKSVQVTKSILPLTGTIDRLLPSYPQGVMRSFGLNATRGMASLRRSADLYHQVSRLSRASLLDRVPETAEDTGLIDSPSISREDELRALAKIKWSNQVADN